MTLNQTQLQLLAAITHPSETTTNSALQLTTSECHSAVQHGKLAVYQTAYHLRLIEALQAHYPKLAQALGPAEFSALCRTYAQLYPSSYRSLRDFGARMGSFLRQHSPIPHAEQLAHLAEFEWAQVEVFDERDSLTYVSFEQLSALAPEVWPKLRFQLIPAFRYLRLPENIDEVWHQTIDFSSPPSCQCVDWAIWRSRYQVYFSKLSPDEALFLQQILSGVSFQTLCEALSQQLAKDSVPSFALQQLNRWCTEQCFTVFHLY